MDDWAEEDEICMDFAMTAAGRGELEEWLWKYPRHGRALVEMWFELQRLAEDVDREFTAEELLESEAACARALAYFWRHLAEIRAEQKMLN